MKLDSLSCHTHITGLCYYDNSLLVGCGQYLEIYCLSSDRLILKRHVFDCFNVNGLQVYESEDKRFVIVYGDRFFSIYEWMNVKIVLDVDSNVDRTDKEINEKFLEMNLRSSENINSPNSSNPSIESTCSLNLIFNKINLYDWILEVQFNNGKIYAMLTSNKMACYDLSTNRLSTIECKSIKFTLYASKFLSQFNCRNSQDRSLNLSSSTCVSPEKQTSHVISQLLNESAIVIAAGTVFSEILICEYTDFSCVVIDRLVGHQGAIFSIDYRQKIDLLVSASDDRTIRVWKFDRNINRFNSMHVLYGHESRIWQVKLSKNCIISCGELSSLIFWSYDGKCLFKEKSKKQSYWRMEVDDANDRVFYGASDGSIKQRSIKRAIKSTTIMELNGISNTKRLKIFEKNENEIHLFVSDNEGKVKVIKIASHNVENERSLDEISAKVTCEFDFGKEYSNYNVLEVETTGFRAILGNIHGEIVKFNYNDNKIQDEHIEIISKHKLFNGKIHKILTTQTELITCSENGIITIWNLENLKFKSQFTLPPAKETQVLNCVLRLDEYLIVFGDRFGNVIVYAFDEICHQLDKTSQSISLVKLFKRIHRSNGVKYLAKHPFQNKFYSCGRDGIVIEYGYRIKNKADNQDDDITKRRSEKGDKSSHHCVDVLRIMKIGLIEIDWIAQIEFDRSTGELMYVCGFKSKLFIVWNNITHSIVWTVDASGGIKEWSFTITSNRLNLIFVKHDKLIHATKLLDQSSLIRSKYHTNTILCAKPLFPSLKSEVGQVKDKFYFITGSEDCDLFINSLDRITKNTLIEAQLNGHISSVKAFLVEEIQSTMNDSKCLSNDCAILNEAVCNLKNLKSSIFEHNLARSFVISVGGASQLIGWDIKLDREHNLTIKQIVNYFIWGPDNKLNNRPWVQRPKNKSDSQVRFMDVNLKRLVDNEFLISSICSDSTLRLFRLSLDQNYIYLISTHNLSNHCPLKMISHNELSIITSTDGSVRIAELRLDRLCAVNFEDQKFKEPEKAKFQENPMTMIINQSDDSLTTKINSRFFQILHIIGQHESGINSIDYIELDTNQFLIFTTGEDTTLGYMVIKCSKLSNQDTNKIENDGPIKVDVESKGNCLLAHSSMVSKVKVLENNLLITASCDKRIKIWQFRLNDGKLQLECKRTIISSIPDISELIIDKNSRHQAHLIVVGQGREIYQIDYDDL